MAGAQRLGELLMTRQGLAIPLLDLLHRPFGRFVAMTPGAGIGDPQFHRQIRAGNAEAVVVARVHHHVGRGRGMAGHAVRARGTRWVKMVLRRFVFRREVTLQANLTAGGAQLAAVRIVAVAATDSLRLHFALQEGAVIEHLILHLPVGIVEIGGQQRQPVGVQQRLAEPVVFPELPAPRMAAGAEFQFAAGGSRRAARSAARGRLGSPQYAGPWVQGGGRQIQAFHGQCAQLKAQAVPLVEGDGQPLGPVQLLPVSLLPGPGEVIGTGAVAGFAGDVDFGPGGVEVVELRIVVLAQLVEWHSAHM